VPPHWWRPKPPGNPGGNPGADEEEYGEGEKRPPRIGRWESTDTRIEYEIVVSERKPSNDAIKLVDERELIPVKDPTIPRPKDPRTTST
jgi:hypothetical protein